MSHPSGMNALPAAPRDPRQLRPLLHQKIDAISDSAIGAVHDLLLEFERRWLFAQMAGEAETDRLAGKHDAELVDQAILAHRSRHPYAA
jgi:hypothetical protein